MSAPPEIPNPKIDLQAWLGATVKTLRRHLGLTQEELAWRAKLHRTYIADIERGARNVTLRSMESLAKALQMTVGELLSNVSVPAPRSNPVTAPGEEILLVEDNEADAALTLRALRLGKLANPLRIVPHAEAAWEYLTGTGAEAPTGPRRPALIVLDLNLPGISGVDFLRCIKADPDRRDIPVVVLTVSRHDRVILECNRLGVANYIVKPLSFADFVRVSPRLNLHLTLGAPRT